MKNFSEMTIKDIDQEWEIFKKVRDYDCLFSKLDFYYFTSDDRERLIDELLNRLKEKDNSEKSLREFDELLIYCLQENVKKFKGMEYQETDELPLYKKYKSELRQVLDATNSLGLC